MVESKEERTVGFGVQVDDCVDDFKVGNCDDVDAREGVGDTVDVTRVVDDDTGLVIDDIGEDFSEVDSKVDNTIEEVVAGDEILNDDFVDDNFFGSVVVDDFGEVDDEVDCTMDKVVAVDDKVDETIDEVVAGDEILDDNVVVDATCFVGDVEVDFNEVDDEVDNTTVDVVAGDDRLDSVDEGDHFSVVKSGAVFVVSLDDIPTCVVVVSVDSVSLVDCSELVVGGNVCCVEVKVVVAEVVVSIP